MIFQLYAIEGYSHKEIADLLKISVGTSKSQINRAKQLLQHWMGGHNLNFRVSEGKDKISDIYRAQVDELLDNQSDLDLYEPLDPDEMNEIWVEISSGIDITETWSKISSDLDILMPV